MSARRVPGVGRAMLLLLAVALVAVAVVTPRSRALAATSTNELWDVALGPVTVCTYQAGRPASVTASEFTDSVSRGVQTWNAVGAAITLEYTGECTSAGLDTGNGANEIVFVQTLSGDSSAIGRTTTRFFVGGFRNESDIRILALPASGPWTPCTLQAVITHELGRLVSLGHSDDPDDVMAPFLIDCTIQVPREVTMDALRGAYGLSPSASPFPEAVVNPVAAVPAVSTEPPFIIFGGGLKVGDAVATTVNGVSCGSATVDTGGGWTILITPETCEYKNGDGFDFSLNGAAATQTFVHEGSSVPGGLLRTIGPLPLTVSGGAPSETPSVAVAPSAPAATVLAVPPIGGTTTGPAGTTDIVALVAAQTFTVDSVWKFDIATQGWQSYVPSAPAFANTLVLTSPSDIISMIRGSGPQITPPASTTTVAGAPIPGTPGSSAATALLGWYDQVTELYDQHFATRVSAGDTLSYAAAGTALFAHRIVVQGYGSTLETAAYSLTSHAPGCDLARGAIAASAGALGNRAGWWALIFVGWPSADHFAEATEAAEIYFGARDLARTAITLCQAAPSATTTETISQITFHPSYDDDGQRFCGSRTEPDNFRGLIGLCWTATYDLPVGATLRVQMDRDGTLVCDYQWALSQEVLSGTSFRSCRPGASSPAFQTGTYTVTFTAGGTVIGTATRFVSILRAPTSAELDALVKLQGDAWSEAINSISVLVTLWNSLTESRPSDALATIARQQRAIAESVLGVARGLEDHPGAADPTIWKWLSSTIEFWELQVQEYEALTDYALRVVPFSDIEAVRDTKNSQFVTHKVNACAVAQLRGYTTWTFADGTPCQ